MPGTQHLSNPVLTERSMSNEIMGYQPSRWTWSLLPLLFLMTLASITMGPYPISWAQLADFFVTMMGYKSGLSVAQYEQLHTLLLEIRLPRILAAILIGASLSVSGAAFQALFMNPLVSPGLLGVLSGAAFGATFAMLLSPHWIVVQVSAFIGGLVAVGVGIGVAQLAGGASPLMLVLGGIISGALFVSLLSIVKYLADPYNQLPAIVYWLMGRLSNVDANTVLFVSIPMVLGILILILHAKHLNVVSMGDEEAQALGVNVTATRYTVILCATLISALTVAMAGMIGWVGLVIPHIARLLIGPNNEKVLPLSAALGALFLLLVDDLSRNLFAVELPVGIVTELIGIPVFLLVLSRLPKGWNA